MTFLYFGHLFYLIYQPKSPFNHFDKSSSEIGLTLAIHENSFGNNLSPTFPHADKSNEFMSVEFLTPLHSYKQFVIFAYLIVRMFEKPVTSKTSITAGLTFCTTIVPCLFIVF